MRPPGSPQELEGRRHRALAMLAVGNQPVNVAERLGMDRHSGRRWKAAHRAKSLAGVLAKPESGRPPTLSGSQRDRLEPVLLKRIEPAGVATLPWTWARITTGIERHFTVRYHVDLIGCVLHALGWSS